MTWFEIHFIVDEKILLFVTFRIGGLHHLYLYAVYLAARTSYNNVSRLSKFIIDTCYALSYLICSSTQTVEGLRSRSDLNRNDSYNVDQQYSLAVAVLARNTVLSSK